MVFPFSYVAAVIIISHEWCIDREGRNERQIDRVKDILISMRKDQTYRETKMRLAQKLTGLEWVRDAFPVKNTAHRDWFKGVHQYESMQSVLDRFTVGKPISCGASKANQNRFFIAFCCGDWDQLSYLTVTPQTHKMFTQETGVHYCEFMVEKGLDRKIAVRTIPKSKFYDMVDCYALMLPYKLNNMTFQRQFTLIYWDHDVLRCDNVPSYKGLPCANECVFSQGHIEDLELCR